MRRTLTVGAATVLALTMATSAEGASGDRSRPLPARQVLHSKAYTIDRQGNTTRVGRLDPRWLPGDSPRDANRLALRVTLPPDVTTRHYQAETAPTSTRHESRPVTRIKNLSFDFRRRTPGGPAYRAPAVVVVAKSGDDLLLWGRYCGTPISARWSRADFTGATSRCALTAYVAAEQFGAHTYTANGQQSAWADYVAANPREVAVSAFVLFEGPIGGRSIRYAVDRLSLGGGFQYGRSDATGRPCFGVEVRC